jgi:hypothetical protein
MLETGIRCEEFFDEATIRGLELIRWLLIIGIGDALQLNLLRCKSVLQVPIVTLVDYCRLARLRACIYRHLLAR